MVYDNISNLTNKNYFEAPAGVLNTSAIKLSGQYKVVIDVDSIMWLDDYTGRRIKVDTSQQFLPQVSAFLRTKTTIVNQQRLKYGGFSSKNVMSWHCPMWIGNDPEQLPKYFIVSKTINDTVLDPSVLQKYSDIVRLVDLKRCGISAIFSEIMSDARNDYPLYINWEDGKYDINGYSITNNSYTSATISMLSDQANQNYFDVFNNKMLNAFQSSDLIFPKFINFEFEFQYINNQIHFNNFYGFLSKSQTINIANFSKDVLAATLKEYDDHMEWVQARDISSITLDSYIKIIGNSSLISINTQPAQLRISIKRIASEDSITIVHADSTIYFEYIIQPDDIKSTLLQTLKQLCIKLTEISQRFLVFTCDTNNIVTIKSNIEDDFIENYKIRITRNFALVDADQDNFRQITSFDVRLGINAGLETVREYEKLKIGNVFYNVVDSFIFDGDAILRLDIEPGIVSSKIAQIYSLETSILKQFSPLYWLSANSNYKAYQQYNVDMYAAELKKKFVDNGTDPEAIDVALTSINRFVEINSAIDTLPYTVGGLTSSDVISYDKVSNSESIKVMAFVSPGQNSFITPNTFNMDIQFFEKNGCPDQVQLKDDIYLYHWFLIKSECPDYLKNDIRSLRYFTDFPKLQSRLILNGSINSGQTYAETIFLGVKYQLPQKYAGWLFSVYLEPNNPDFFNIGYSFDIDNVNRTLALKVSKYFDFVDLIRGGDSQTPAFLDLGLIYSAKEPYNTRSNVLSGFKSGGILLCDTDFETIFDNSLIRDWKVLGSDGKWYICLKRSFAVVTGNFDDLFPTSGDTEIFVYSSVEYNGATYEYVSMSFLIKSIKIVKADYLWCEDIQIKFFDTETFFINEYGSQAEKIFLAEKSSIIASASVSNEVFGDNNIIATMLIDGNNKQYRLLNHDKTFSLKENYFEITRNVDYPLDSALPKVTTNAFFVFPEFSIPGSTFNTLYNKFNNNSFDAITPRQKITIFERNQIWHMIRDIMITDIKFKAATEKQVKNYISDLLISQLKDYTDLNALRAGSDFITMSVIEPDVNLAIWKIKDQNRVTKINRFKGPYLPYLKKLDNEYVFQSDITTNRQDRLYSMFDKDFGGVGITATGIWDEVEGNVLSTLFTVNKTFGVEKPFDISFDIREILKNVITLDNAIIGNNNSDYIKKIDSNVNEYILNSYIEWLLLNEYQLTEAVNELNQKVAFTYDAKNLYLVNFKSMESYQTKFKNLTFNFNRK